MQSQHFIEMSENFSCCQNNFSQAAGVFCATCKAWVHLICSGLPPYQIRAYANTTRKYECAVCIEKSDTNYAIGIDEINTSIREQSEALKKMAETIHSENLDGISQNQSEIPSNPDQRPATVDTGTPPPSLNPNGQTVHVLPEGDAHGNHADDTGNNSVPRDSGNQDVRTLNAPPNDNLGSRGGHSTNFTQRRKICEAYYRNWCYNIRHCKYLHPNICPAYMEDGYRRHGCTDRRCKLFHPIICESSWNNRECLNLECEDRHLRHTRRKAPPPAIYNRAPFHGANFTQGSHPPIPPGHHIQSQHTPTVPTYAQVCQPQAGPSTSAISLEDVKEMMRQLMREEFLPQFKTIPNTFPAATHQMTDLQQGAVPQFSLSQLPPNLGNQQNPVFYTPISMA